MWPMGRRDFFKVAAAAAAAEGLRGCAPTENAYYRAGFELGSTQKVKIKFMLRQFVREFPDYLEVVREEVEKARKGLFAHDLPPSADKRPDPNTMRVLGDTITGGQLVASALYRQSPNNYYKLAGIADGAFGPYMRDFMFMLQCLEVTMPRLNYIDPGLCSAVGLRSAATTFGEPVLAKNFDLLNVAQYGCVTRKTLPDGKLPSLDNTMNIMPGAISALNPHLGMTHNTLPGAYMNGQYLPGTCTAEDVAETCRSVDAAVSALEAVVNGGYFLLTMVDAYDGLALVESTPYGKEVVVPERDYLVVTNHSQCPHPGAPEGAIRTDIAPDTFIRHERLTHLVEEKLAKNGKFSLEDIKKVMSDHENGGGLNSICRHSSIAGTVSTVIMLPRSGRMLVASGHPCETPFVEYRLARALS